MLRQTDSWYVGFDIACISAFLGALNASSSVLSKRLFARQNTIESSLTNNALYYFSPLKFYKYIYLEEEIEDEEEEEEQQQQQQ